MSALSAISSPAAARPAQPIARVDADGDHDGSTAAKAAPAAAAPALAASGNLGRNLNVVA